MEGGLLVAFDINDINKEFAHILGIMLEARLIWYKHYDLWCKEIIEQLNNPPVWITELSKVKYLPKAFRIVNDYAYSEPLEYLEKNRSDLYVACLLLRYDRREISWATFLREAGDFTDGNDGGKETCGFFYKMLNQYEDSDYSVDVEQIQNLKVKNIFESDINEMVTYYELFKSYYKKYINMQCSAPHTL